ncbi:MAG: hypothetical protein ACHP9T_08105, partial [Caulobacterales bacterium]
MRSGSILGLGVAALFFASGVQASPRPAARDAKVWAAAEAARPAQLKLLQQVVDVDSGTGDVAGG